MKCTKKILLCLFGLRVAIMCELPGLVNVAWCDLCDYLRCTDPGSRLQIHLRTNSADQNLKTSTHKMGVWCIEAFALYVLTLIVGAEVVNETRYVGDGLKRREGSECFWSIESFKQELGRITSGCRPQGWVRMMSLHLQLFSHSFFFTSF